MPKLRRLRYENLSEVADEIARLRDGGYARGGAWSLEAMCDHLTKTMRIGLDGTHKPAPWLLRATIGNLVFWLFASRVLPGLSGVKTLPELVPEGVVDAGAIDRCLDTLREAIARTAPLPTYPFATSVSLDRWRQMMLVHSEHHLEFLAPVGDGSVEDPPIPIAS